jgi:hypothetical protein
MKPYVKNRRIFTPYKLLVRMYQVFGTSAVLSLSGCASWDWQPAPDYADTLVQQGYYDTQLRNQQNYAANMAMINQYQAYNAAQQQMYQYNALQSQIGHLQRSIDYATPTPAMRYQAIRQNWGR